MHKKYRTDGESRRSGPTSPTETFSYTISEQTSSVYRAVSSTGMPAMMSA